MAATIQDFYDLIQPSVQGCPATILDSAIRASINEFCDKSLIWNQELFYGNLVDGQRIYKINYIDSPVSIIMPLKVIIRYQDDNGKYISKELKNTNLQELNDLDSTWRDITSNEPISYYMEEPSVLSIVEKPKDLKHNYELFMSCAVKLARNSEEVPDFIFDDWAETIAHGALYRLHAISGRVWANPTMTAYHTAKFKEGVSRAKSKMYKSYAVHSKTMIPKTFQMEYYYSENNS